MADSESKSADSPSTPSEESSDASQLSEKSASSQALATDPQDTAVAGPAQLGTTKYVHAAFFAAGVLSAYLSGKVLETIWNTLADWPPAIRNMPILLRYAEDERPTFAMSAGAVIAILAVFRVYRRQRVRQWADEVAAELAKVHWPERETVTNGTIVVLVAGAFATIYVGLLDRLWGFVTTLVYGA